MLITLTKTMKVPLLVFLFKIYSCDNNKVSLEMNKFITGYCYTGVHLDGVIYATIMAIALYMMNMYFHYMLSLSYPHERVPWAALPSKVPFLIELLEFMIIFCYSETKISKHALSYMNIVFALLCLLILQ